MVWERMETAPSQFFSCKNDVSVLTLYCFFHYRGPPFCKVFSILFVFSAASLIVILVTLLSALVWSIIIFQSSHIVRPNRFFYWPTLLYLVRFLVQPNLFVDLKYGYLFFMHLSVFVAFVFTNLIDLLQICCKKTR